MSCETCSSRVNPLAATSEPTRCPAAKALWFSSNPMHDRVTYESATIQPPPQRRGRKHQWHKLPTLTYGSRSPKCFEEAADMMFTTGDLSGKWIFIANWQ